MKRRKTDPGDERGSVEEKLQSVAIQRLLVGVGEDLSQGRGDHSARRKD
jgi:hypothetical protein